MEKVIKCVRLRWVFVAALAVVIALTIFSLPPIWQKTYAPAIKEGELSFFAQTEDKININTANEAEIMGLPSIGKKRAAAIIADRAANGPFENVESIARVPGISKASIEKIKMSISFKRDEGK